MNVTLMFKWHQDNVDEISEWAIYYGTHSGGPYEKGPIVISNDESHSATGNVEVQQTIAVPDDVDTTYYFVIVAMDKDGRKSVGSNEVVFKFDLAPPMAPDSFEVTSLSG